MPYLKRRRQDRSAMAHIVENPYIRMAGFVVTVITMIFMCGGIWRDVSASMSDVETLKKWRSGADMDIAVMKNQIDEIHAYLLPEKHHENR